MSDLDELKQALWNGDPCAPDRCELRNERSCMCYRAGEVIERQESKLRSLQDDNDIWRQRWKESKEREKVLLDRLGSAQKLLQRVVYDSQFGETTLIATIRNIVQPALPAIMASAVEEPLPDTDIHKSTVSNTDNNRPNGGGILCEHGNDDCLECFSEDMGAAVNEEQRNCEVCGGLHYLDMDGAEPCPNCNKELADEGQEP